MNQQELQALLSVEGVLTLNLSGLEVAGGPYTWALYVRRYGERQDVEPLRDARGSIKEWRSLDTAFAWVRRLGWSHEVSVTGASGSAS